MAQFGISSQKISASTSFESFESNASTGRTYSGINILLLWGAIIECGISGESGLTFRQALFLEGMYAWVSTAPPSSIPTASCRKRKSAMRGACQTNCCVRKRAVLQGAPIPSIETLWDFWGAPLGGWEGFPPDGRRIVIQRSQRFLWRQFPLAG
ncbi:ArdC-like ssDNA-binding domain-containing protein [Marinomonas transparens]|uniref:DUF1738 domain-containing protein n=1 Tax=Marinomonas transparens TaxID=2795388 RepID=A0A934JTP4_9GAMM|nr:ArdC-like ssDNA-binding domain-containing protein [Marinomonas transparens]MBJ7537124.1 DUF1738 domain-containing protein [Marinomonas transparens]